MLARRDTRSEASRLRHLSPLQTFEDQSQTWGIRGHSCTGREGLPPLWQLSYKTEVLRFTREPRSSFNQRIARLLMSHVMLGMRGVGQKTAGTAQSPKATTRPAGTVANWSMLPLPTKIRPFE